VKHRPVLPPVALVLWVKVVVLRQLRLRRKVKPTFEHNMGVRLGPFHVM